MDRTEGARTIREAVGIFFDSRHLHEAVDELLAGDFDRSQLGLLAGEYSVKSQLGEFYTQINASANQPRWR